MAEADFSPGRPRPIVTFRQYAPVPAPRRAQRSRNRLLRRHGGRDGAEVAPDAADPRAPTIRWSTWLLRARVSRTSAGSGPSRTWKVSLSADSRMAAAQFFRSTSLFTWIELPSFLVSVPRPIRAVLRTLTQASLAMGLASSRVVASDWIGSVSGPPSDDRSTATMMMGAVVA